jgi:hypothetical protein
MYFEVIIIGIKIVIVKPEGKKPLGGFRLRWEVSIEIELTKMRREDVD